VGVAGSAGWEGCAAGWDGFEGWAGVGWDGCVVCWVDGCTGFAPVFGMVQPKSSISIKAKAIRRMPIPQKMKKGDLAP
jgi:hypothetical protein